MHLKNILILNYMRIVKSPLKNKRYRAIFKDKSHTDFGYRNKDNGKTAITYIDGASLQKRDAYIKRHRVNEDWANYKKAGTLSRYILWGDSKSIKTNIAKYKSRFNL